MGIIAKDVVRRVQTVLQDSDPAYTRWPLVELTDWINDGAAEIVIRRPAARAITASLELVAGTRQDIPATGLELMDVIRNMGVDGNTPGRSIRVINRYLLDEQLPDWHTVATGITKHFAFDERDPTQFWVFPQATVGNQVEIRYSEPPPALTSVQVDDGVTEIDMDRAYIGPLTSYVVWRAMSKDSEYGNGVIATQHFTMFNEALGTRNAVTAAVSPNEGAG